jgi:hypothetical protein
VGGPNGPQVSPPRLPPGTAVLRTCEQPLHFEVSHQRGRDPVRYDLTGWLRRAKPNLSAMDAPEILQQSQRSVRRGGRDGTGGDVPGDTLASSPRGRQSHSSPGSEGCAGNHVPSLPPSISVPCPLPPSISVPCPLPPSISVPCPLPPSINVPCPLPPSMRVPCPLLPP